MRLAEFLITTFSFVIVAIVAVAITNFAVKRSEHAECIKWAQQAQEYPGFYYTDWQKQQCKIK